MVFRNMFATSKYGGRMSDDGESINQIRYNIVTTSRELVDIATT